MKYWTIIVIALSCIVFADRCSAHAGRVAPQHARRGLARSYGMATLAPTPLPLPRPRERLTPEEGRRLSDYLLGE